MIFLSRVAESNLSRQNVLFVYIEAALGYNIKYLFTKLGATHCCRSYGSRVVSQDTGLLGNAIDETGRLILKIDCG